MSGTESCPCGHNNYFVYKKERNKKVISRLINLQKQLKQIVYFVPSKTSNDKEELKNP